MIWPTKKLGEICEKIKAGGTPSRKNPKYWDGEIPFIKIEDITSTKLYLENTQEKITQEGLNNSNAWILPPNSILFSIYASIGEVAINKVPVATNQAILGLIPKKSIIDFKFLAYALKKFGKYLISYNIQSTQKNLTLEIVKNLEIPLPPLPIQQKIVKVLDTIQEAIEIQEKIIEKTKELKKSLMNLLFHYGLAGLRVKELASLRVGELTSSDIEKLGLKLKKTEIGEIPEHWEVVKIKDVHKWKVNLINPKDFPNEEFEYYSIPAFHEKGLPLRIYGKKIGSSKILIEPGTILFGKLNPKLPKVWLARNFYEGLRKIATTEFLPLISTEKIDPFFSFYLMESWFVLPIAQAAVDGSTTSRQRISPDSFYSIKIPLPPLPEQQEIADILQTIDQKIEIEKKKKELYEELFKTLLNKIMNQEINIENIEI